MGTAAQLPYDLPILQLPYDLPILRVARDGCDICAAPVSCCGGGGEGLDLDGLRRLGLVARLHPPHPGHSEECPPADAQAVDERRELLRSDAFPLVLRGVPDGVGVPLDQLVRRTVLGHALEDQVVPLTARRAPQRQGVVLRRQGHPRGLGEAEDVLVQDVDLALGGLAGDGDGHDGVGHVVPFRVAVPCRPRASRLLRPSWAPLSSSPREASPPRKDRVDCPASAAWAVGRGETPLARAAPAPFSPREGSAGPQGRRGLARRPVPLARAAPVARGAAPLDPPGGPPPP